MSNALSEYEDEIRAAADDGMAPVTAAIASTAITLAPGTLAPPAAAAGQIHTHSHCSPHTVQPLTNTLSHVCVQLYRSTLLLSLLPPLQQRPPRASTHRRTHTHAQAIQAANATRKREREQREGPQIVRLTAKHASPVHGQAVLYSEAKEYILGKSDLSQKLMLAERDIEALSGHFTATAEDQEHIQTLARLLHVRWGKDGASKAVRDRRVAVLLATQEKVHALETAFEKLRRELQVQRAKELLFQQQVQRDANIAQDEEDAERQRVELQRQQNNLKFAQQKAAAEAKMRKLENMSQPMPKSAAAKSSLFTDKSAAAAAGAIVKPPRYVPSSQRAAAPAAPVAAADRAADEDAEEESAEEVAQHAAEEQEEERDAMEEEEEEDAAFIAPEGHAE